MASKLFYLAKWAKCHHIPFLPKIIQMILRYLFGLEISPNMRCGGGVILAHGGLGCVFHPKAVIGNNVKILQNVTIGGRSGSGGLPQIGDNVIIGCGAAILGKVRIGNNAKIGANAVVLSDVPDNATAVGIPARIILNSKIVNE